MAVTVRDHSILSLEWSVALALVFQAYAFALSQASFLWLVVAQAIGILVPFTIIVAKWGTLLRANTYSVLITYGIQTYLFSNLIINQDHYYNSQSFPSPLSTCFELRPIFSYSIMKNISVDYSLQRQGNVGMIFS